MTSANRRTDRSLKKRAYMAFVLLLALGALGAVFFATAPLKDDSTRIVNAPFPPPPAFESYPATRVFAGEPAPVNFDSLPAAKQFTTVIARDAARGPNFAGKYTIVTWGCGTQCQSSAVIDAENGNIVEYGILSGTGLSYVLDSALLIVNPPPGPEAADDVPHPVSIADYYVMAGGGLEFVGRYDYSSGNLEPVGCPDVETLGRHSVTGKEKVFGGPCIVPYGWNIVSSLDEGTAAHLLREYLFERPCVAEGVSDRYRSCSLRVTRANDAWLIELVYDGLYDDSVRAARLRAQAAFQDNAWVLVGDVIEDFRCQGDRGHQDFGTEACI